MPKIRHKAFELYIVNSTFTQMLDCIENVIDVQAGGADAAPDKMRLPFKRQVACILAMMPIHHEAERLHRPPGSIQ